MWNKGKKYFWGIAGILVFLLIWQLVVQSGWWDTNLLPSPGMVADALGELYKEGLLGGYTYISLYRFGIGYGIAVLLALPLGLLLGWFKGILWFVNPVLQIIRPISPIAWFPFVVLWFGIGDPPAIVIIIIAAFFPVLFATISAMSKIDDTYLKVSAVYELSQFQFFYKIAFPLAFPYITVGLHASIGTAWIFLVAGEMVGAQSGLGYLIIDARNSLRMDMALAGILLIGAIGWILDTVMTIFENYIYRQWGIEKG